MNAYVLILTGVLLAMSSPAWASEAKAFIKGTAPDSKISGEALFKEEDGGLVVEAIVAGLAPGKHGFHIHENGSCEDSGKAAGGHFNPEKMDHGFMPKDGMTHAHPGDMGNIDVGIDGTGTVKVLLAGVTLADGEYAVLNKAIIIHEKEDDFSQPTGNAGGRIGCGIIEVQK